MSEEKKIRSAFLNAICEKNIPIAIFLINGIKLHGQLIDFDEEAVILKNTHEQMIFQHAISTIAPVQTLMREVSSEKQSS